MKLISSDASERCGLKEISYILVITPVALQLRETDENETLLLIWPYRFIRRYGYRADRFTFEAGRKCMSGEGVFHLEHSNQQEIFRCISSKMKSMKKLLNGESTTPSNMCVDNQFRAALSMMARSRSPIPPSPTSTLLILDNDLNSFSCSTKPLMPLPSLNSIQPPLPPPLKPKPKKIFSKKLPTPFLNEPYCETKEMESPDATYEDVLVRNDAWRTLGQDDSNFFEKPCVSNTLVSDDGLENYDRLQHFGFISKTAPGYRQIHPIALTTKHKPYIKEDTIMMPARKADDSHYGYGTINKKTTIEESRSNNEFLNTVPHNELQYAMVLKPNKV